MFRTRKTSTADPPTAAAPARRSFTGVAILGGFVLLGLICCAGLVWPTVQSVVGDLAGIVFGLLLLAITLTVHAVSTWWTLHQRSHWTRWALTQAPPLVMYGLLYWWYLVPWSVEDGGPPPLWVLPWAGLALTAFAWLWVWWLDHARQRNPKHAIVFLALLVLLVAGNGATGAIIAWKHTSGFGLAGHPSPDAALDAFIATTCLFGTDMYRQGDRLISPDCPNDLGSAPAERLDDQLSNNQPSQVLQRWYQRYQQFRYLPHLTHGTAAIQTTGNTATARYAITLPLRAEGQDLSSILQTERWCLPSGRDETWTVQLQTALAGGWKVTHLDIATSVEVIPFSGSACDHPTSR